MFPVRVWVVVFGLGFMAYPSAAQGQVTRCEFCNFGECQAVDDPEDCRGLFKRNSCSCYPFCNCTSGKECEAETCEPTEEPEPLLPDGTELAVFTFSDGWQVQGAWLGAEAFGVFSKCGSLEDVIYSRKGIEERRRLARSLTFSAPR